MSSAIRLIRQGTWATTSLVKPTVLLDGRPVPTVIGATVLPVAPGVHRVDVRENDFGAQAPVAAMVTVAQGRMVDVYYAPPMTRFDSGRLGAVPQERAGREAATAL